MKLLTTFSLLIALLIGTKAFAQPCSVILSASDSLICSGDNISLNALANGPELQLQASNTAGNNHRGNMFDIVATNDVTILSFDAFPMGNTTISIYYKVGTWNGFANTPSAWTFIGEAPVTYTGGFSPVDVDVNVTIPAGETYAFYVTTNVTGGTALNYSNGTNVGNVYSSDANITFLEGGGMEYPFTMGTGAVYQPRVWNGMIHYSLANQPGTTITWGNGETTSTIVDEPLVTTEYTVSASVVGCPITMHDTLDVIVSIPIVGVGNVETTVCAGTEILLYGTGAETYSWDNAVLDSISFNIDNTETYTVIGTDSIGCTGSDFVTITVNQNPNVSAGPDINICEGNSLTLEGSGATSYVWNNSITNGVPFEPTTATYIVTGTDNNGCSTIDSVEVVVISAPTVSAGSDIHICLGEGHTLSGTGSSPAVYTWNNGVLDGVTFNPTVTNIYTVTATDTNGCTATDQVSVFIHSVTASIFSSGSILSAGTLVDMTAQWVNCSDMSPIPGATSSLFEPQNGGTYAIIVQDNEYGCRDTSNCIEISFLGIDDELENQTLSVYPVPTNTTVNINSDGTIIDRIELMDLLGKVLETTELNGYQTTLDLSGYASNTYIVRVYRGEKTTLMRIIKN